MESTKEALIHLTRHAVPVEMDLNSKHGTTIKNDESSLIQILLPSDCAFNIYDYQET